MTKNNKKRPSCMHVANDMTFGTMKWWKKTKCMKWYNLSFKFYYLVRSQFKIVLIRTTTEVNSNSIFP